MKPNKVISRLEDKSKQIRLLDRTKKFQDKRNQTHLSYRHFYAPQTWNCIKQSMQSPIPNPLPPLSKETITYYRRNGTPVYKTRLAPGSDLQPHMTFESLWSLTGKLQIEQYPDYQQVIKCFEQQLKLYIAMPFPEIREMAIIAAGNKILGKDEDILNIVKNDTSQLWVLVNHVLERKISFEYLFNFLDEENTIIFCTIYEMTNTQKDAINDYIISNENILLQILKCFESKNIETQSFAIRIIGNILAEKEDYGSKISNYNILNIIFPILKSSDKQIRRDACWLLGNYTFEKAPAAETLCKSNLMERLFSMLKDQQYINAKIQLYFIFVHLVCLGERAKIYSLIHSEHLLEICARDIDTDDTQLCYIILQLISHIIEVGQEFVDYQQDTGNQFINMINRSELRKSISTKTFYPSDEISSLSFDIQDKLNVDGNDMY